VVGDSSHTIRQRYTYAVGSMTPAHLCHKGYTHPPPELYTALLLVEYRAYPTYTSIKCGIAYTQLGICITQFYLALSDFLIAVTPLHYTAYNAGSQWGAAIGSISA